MSILVYAGDGKCQQTATVHTNESPVSDLVRPENYLADSKLVDTVNTALMHQQPLLITGEPGAGKTQLARSLAWELGLGEPLCFLAQPTSLTRDLFYTYDARGHYRAAQQTGRSEPLAFLHYHALGEAILRANDPAEVNAFIPPGFEHNEQRRTVVLVDEIDQAPDTFAEDLIGALNRMSFRVRELKNAELRTTPDMRPIVVITSDLHKPPPEVLLDACAHYQLAFPDAERIKAIATSRLGERAGLNPEVFDDAVAFFLNLREQTQARPRPGLQEFLNWLLSLRGIINGREGDIFLREPDRVVDTLDQLLTRTQDLKHADMVLSEWLMIQRRR